MTGVRSNYLLHYWMVHSKYRNGIKFPLLVIFRNVSLGPKLMLNTNKTNFFYLENVQSACNVD